MTDVVALMSAGTATIGIAISVGANRIASGVRRDGSTAELLVLAREFLANYADYRGTSLPLWMDAIDDPRPMKFWARLSRVRQRGQRPSDDPVIVDCHRQLELARVQATIISSWEAQPLQLGALAASAEWLVTCMFAQHFALTTPSGNDNRSARAEWRHLVYAARQHVPWRADATAALAAESQGKVADGPLDRERTAANVASEALDDAARDFTATISATLAQRARLLRWRSRAARPARNRAPQTHA